MFSLGAYTRWDAGGRRSPQARVLALPAGVSHKRVEHALHDSAARLARIRFAACFFVSDDGANRILKVIPQDSTHRVYASHVCGANGLAFDAQTRTMYVAGLSETTTASEYHGALYKAIVQPFPLDEATCESSFDTSTPACASAAE